MKNTCRLVALIIVPLLLLVPFVVASKTTSDSTDDQRLVKKGVYLVAKPKLHGSSFQQTVIIITHYSDREVMGFTVNRPTDALLNHAFPDDDSLKQNSSLIYLGGPVRPKTIFVLTRTEQPKEKMQHVIDDVYLASVKDAFSPPVSKTTRIFSGYAGWTPKQLQNEIRRGDWQIVHTGPEIIFEKDTATLWHKLVKKWSGKWT